VRDPIPFPFTTTTKAKRKRGGKIDCQDQSHPGGVGADFGIRLWRERESNQKRAGRRCRSTRAPLDFPHRGGVPKWDYKKRKQRELKEREIIMLHFHVSGTQPRRGKTNRKTERTRTRTWHKRIKGFWAKKLRNKRDQEARVRRSTTASGGTFGLFSEQKTRVFSGGESKKFPVYLKEVLGGESGGLKKTGDRRN